MRAERGGGGGQVRGIGLGGTIFGAPGRKGQRGLAFPPLPVL